MKKLLYTLAAVLVCTGAAAQNPTLYFMEGVPLRSQMNPALAPQRGYFNIPVLGGLAVTAGGNTSLDHLLFRRDGRLVTLLSPSVSSADALSDLHSKNLVNADIRVNLLGFGAYTANRKHFWSFDLNLRTSVSTQFPYELFHFYDVENIIRFGSAGALHPDLHLGDIVIAEGACTDSNYMAQFQLPGTFAPIADWKLLSTAARLAEERRLKHMVGNVLSSDVFYSAHPERTDLWRPMGVLCVEMEISALYANAAFAGKHALGILSISDVIGKNEEMTPEERQTKFTSIMELALDTVTGL